MELRKYIQTAVVRNVFFVSQQAPCVESVYQRLDEHEKLDPGFHQRIVELLARREFTGSPEWRIVQQILSESIKEHRG